MASREMIIYGKLYIAHKKKGTNEYDHRRRTPPKGIRPAWPDSVSSVRGEMMMRCIQSTDIVYETPGSSFG